MKEQQSNVSGRSILIVCDSFPPNFAPRMGCLARYLAKWGWDVRVLSTHLWGGEALYGIPDLDVPVKRVRAKDRMGERLNFVERFVWRLVCGNGEYQPLVGRMIEEGQALLAQRSADVIVASSSYSPFIFDVANRLAEEHGIPWIADLRDMFEQLPKAGPGINLKKYYARLWCNEQARRRNELLKKASACIGVTPLHQKALAKLHPHVALIFNGYDPQVLGRVQPARTSQFRVFYGGQIYEDLRYQNPLPLFEALQEMDKRKEITPTDFRVQFLVMPKCKKYIERITLGLRVQQYLDIEDHLPTAAYAARLTQASVALLFASSHTQGVMTTKFFQYMIVGLPILLVESDGDCLERTMGIAQCGVAAKTSDEACAFLREKYAEWKATGRVAFSTDQAFAEGFSRELQAREFVDVIEQAVARGHQAGA